MASARARSILGSDRRPGLDTLRATATILVVMLHAGVPYTVAPMPGLTWPVRHAAVSSVVDLVFWGIEGTIMPLFYVLSGYGAAQSLAHRPTDFLSTRWRRLGWPLIAAAVVILPIELYIWLIGWATDGQIPWQKLRSLKLNEFHQDLWGLSHLWYLEYLLIYSGALWAGKKFVVGRVQPGLSLRRVAGGRWKRRLPPAIDVMRSLGHWPRAHATLWSSPVGVIIVATALLWLAPEVVVGFQHGFLPFPLKFLYSGLFFAIGVCEFHRPTSFAPTTRSKVLAAVCLMIGLMPLIHRQAAQPLSGCDRFVLAAGLACYAVLVTQVCLQTALTSRSAVAPVVVYLAKASFWIYLVHHPLAAIWQISLRSTGWPGLLQFAIVTIGTLAVSIASYEWLVCRTWLGDFLDGRRSVAAPAAATIPAPVEIPVRRAA